MSFTELLPAVQSLPQSDKVRLLEYLNGDLKTHRGESLIDGNVQYPFWSQFDAFEAAEIMQREMQKSEHRP